MSIVTLSLSDSKLFNTRVNIIDVSGKIHLNFVINANTKNMDVSKLPTGMYMIRLKMVAATGL
ncbi:MAG: T9SS type A sorting domain-containing protein [Rhizobacter sp.]|nr:T9SS type A sorting domain-containing protein [Ferruginibacter sp.]